MTLISLMFAMYKNIKVKVLKTPRRAIIVQFKLSTRYYHPTCLRWENMNVIDFQFDRLDTKCQIHIIGEMGTQWIHSLQLRDGCLRGERPAPQHGSVQDLHIPPLSFLCLDEALRPQPAKDLRLHRHHELWGRLPPWRLVFGLDQRSASHGKFHLVSRT